MKLARINLSKAYLLLGVLLLAWLVYNIFNVFKKMNLSTNEDLPITYKLTKEDTIKLGNKLTQKLKVEEVRNSRVRKPLFVCQFENKYPLIFCEFELPECIKFPDIEVKKESVERTTGITYNIINNLPLFRFQYKIGSPQLRQKLFFTFGSDSIVKQIFEDSFVLLSGDFQNFSLRFEKDKPIDLYLEVGKGSSIFSRSLNFILCLKRSSASVYIYLLTSDSFENPIPEEAINSFYETIDIPVPR